MQAIDVVANAFPNQGHTKSNFAVDGPAQIGRQIDRPRKALDVSMESLVMRNRLQVSFWGLHLAADGIVAISAALFIVLVFALLFALRF